MSSRVGPLDPQETPREPEWIRVRFDGQTLWVESAVLRGERDGCLAPEHHVRDGELDFSRCFDGDTYAHVYQNGIMRYHRKVGERSDLIPIDRVAVVEAPANPTRLLPEKAQSGVSSDG